MADVYPYQPNPKGQELMEARCPGVYRVIGPDSLPDADGFTGWVEVLYYTRDMQGKQVDAARRVRVNPGLISLRAPGRIFYGGGTRAGDCVVERLDGAIEGETEHFLTQYVHRPSSVPIPFAARALVVNPSRETSESDVLPLELRFYIEGTEIARHLLRSNSGRIMRGGATSFGVTAVPFPQEPHLYWTLHWVMDL
jgi:hypothetical protein